MKSSIFFISLGCPRNLVDSEILIGRLEKKGLKVFYKFKKHSIAIVNTCGFIEDAKSESIDVILELAELKKKGVLEKLVVTGCLSQRYAEHLMKEIEEIDALFGTNSFIVIPEYIDRIRKGEKIVLVDKKMSFLYNHRMPRFIMTGGHSVYVKIQEGCMNFCSYCIIPKIKGPFRSRSIGSVLKEVASLKASGAKEINLIGQDTTLYGIDRYKNLKLASLLKEISQIMDSGWVRLLYTHPAHYNQDLISVFKDESSICKYVDLPIQHISDKILKKMNRRVTKKDIVTLIAKLRKSVPSIALRTSIIVGFPGESDKDFSELEEFICETRFERLGVFIYSREEDTPAYNFKGQIPYSEKRERFNRIMELQKRISEENNKNYVGKKLKVLIDEKDISQADQFIGRTEYDAPEIDGIVYVSSKRNLNKGDFVDVKIEDTLEYDLVGSV